MVMLENRYDFTKVEPRLQSFWAENGIYKFSSASPGEVYSIDTPPPTVSGHLHIGHIFSYTQAEIIARFHRMQGKNVFYPFGFDDNGLPTERLVEKDEGISAHSLKRSEFIERCMKTTERYEAQFKELWTQLGFSCDWSLKYETISPLAQRVSQKSFLELVKKGKAYRKESPSLWCTTCQTSIAQADLEPREMDSTFITIPFMIGDQPVPVATTRPELLYGCVALFVHPEDTRYTDFVGKEAVVPLYGFNIPVLPDSKVSMEKGTGAVMCATFGDTTDLEWYHTYGLPYKKVILPNGHLADDVPYIGGLKAVRAREQIISLLRQEGLLLESKPINHTVSVHERCGKEIEIIPSPQWFIDVLSDRETYLKAADQINWYPESMKLRYQLWVENLKWDWCISRQRYFGVPFPVWYCKSCGAVILADEASLPVNPLETQPRPHGRAASDACDQPPTPCACGSTEFIPEAAVLDTWATSSVSPLINARWGEPDERSEFIPMSMRTQAHEIIRTWAFYTIVKSFLHKGVIPWKDIMICGFVMAKKGEKISKSKDNASTSPQALIKKYSADGVRYWSASSKLGTDSMFSEDDLTTSGRFLTKLWNASKFCLMHLKGYEPGCMGEQQALFATSSGNHTGIQLLPVDRWIMLRCAQIAHEAQEQLMHYETGSARHILDEFFWRDFCDYYLEIVKDRLYKPEIHGLPAQASAHYALYHTLFTILKLYAIFVPHITEEIYQAYFRQYEKTVSIHKCLWSNPLSENQGYAQETDLLGFGDTLKAVIDEVRRYKSERNLSLRAEIKALTLTLDPESINYFAETLNDLKACTACESITINKAEAHTGLPIVTIDP